MGDAREVKNSTLMITMQAAVPLHILRLKGKPIKEILDQGELKRASELLTEKGDILLFGGKGAAEVFNATASAIARLSFLPGGIGIFGCHWESEAAGE